MLGLTPDAWGALGAAAGALGTGVAMIYGRVQAGDKRAHDLETEQTRKDIERLDASQKAAWVHVDDLRFNAVRRQDQDKLREEFRADIKALGDRVEAAISALRDEIHRDKKV